VVWGGNDGGGGGGAKGWWTVVLHTTGVVVSITLGAVRGRDDRTEDDCKHDGSRYDVTPMMMMKLEWTRRVIVVLLVLETVHAFFVFCGHYLSHQHLTEYRQAQQSRISICADAATQAHLGTEALCRLHARWWPSESVWVDAPYLRRIAQITWDEEWQHLYDSTSWLTSLFHPSGSFYMMATMVFLFLNQHWAMLGPTVLALFVALIQAMTRFLWRPWTEGRKAAWMRQLHEVEQAAKQLDVAKNTTWQPVFPTHRRETSLPIAEWFNYPNQPIDAQVEGSKTE
jgi:hypothetical protein